LSKLNIICAGAIRNYQRAIENNNSGRVVRVTKLKGIEDIAKSDGVTGCTRAARKSCLVRGIAKVTLNDIEFPAQSMESTNHQIFFIFSKTSAVEIRVIQR
jgi:hypothetical protein